ncbi:MAG: terminase [Bacteroidales bacterium]|nr:terminase [Bacteroidales bacterium]
MNDNDIIKRIIAENEARNAKINVIFNPVTGQGSIGQRKRVEIADFPIPVQWLPIEMLDIPLVSKIIACGSVKKFLMEVLRADYTERNCLKVIEQFVRVRYRHDFPFWAATLARIKPKGGGEDILFVLNRPQRRLVERFELLRVAGKPIRIVLLKARQWGGSTVIQMYMAWLQLVHQVGLNSLIVALQNKVSDEIQDMFRKMIESYPLDFLHRLGETYSPTEAKMVGVGKSGDIHRIPQRNCKIKIGSAQRPDSVRGGDYNLVHCSEVGLWVRTEGKSPEDMVRSACSGVLYRPYTMIVYESTANGTGNFFQHEYDAAKEGKSQFQSFFIAWYEIEQYVLPIDDVYRFAYELYHNKDNVSAADERHTSGKYLWWLWEQGATLEAINWYITERSEHTDDGKMASEFPSNDIEAFVHSGSRVFDKYHVEQFKRATRPPKFIGDVYADGIEGKAALQNIRFSEDRQGLLWVWSKPEIAADVKITDRYCTVVDIGGRGHKSDWSVIVVFDRLMQMDGGKPLVVAQWYGHIDMDLLAWKAAQISAYYDNALLVIESNTLETHDAERRDRVDGDMSGYILNQIKDIYPNLYARPQSDDEIRAQAPRKYGFHTNIATKPKIISTLVKVIRENLYVERDKRCLEEYLCYEKKKNGSFGAIEGKHDDLLMTRAIGLHICFYEMELPKTRSRTAPRITHRKTVGMSTL